MDFRKKNYILRISPILFLLWAGFIYSYAQDIPKTTKVTISISGPVKYHHYIKEEPPSIVIEFKSKNLVSYLEGTMQGTMQVNKGVIKEINTEYYPAKRNEPQALKSLTFLLTRKTPYNIVQTEDAIVIEVENPSGVELPLGEIVIPGKFGVELQMQKKEALEKAIAEVKQKLEEPTKLEEPPRKEIHLDRQDTNDTRTDKAIAEVKQKLEEPTKLEEPPRKEIHLDRQDTKDTRTKVLASKAIPKKGKQNYNFFYFLFFPTIILMAGYFLWKRSKTKKTIKPQISKEPLSLVMERIKLEKELEKLKEEKQQLETKLTEKENLEKRLLNIELLESQLRKTKTDLEEANSLRQQLEEKLKEAEKQREEKDIQRQQLLKDAQERELNLRNELKTKEELIRQLSDEKESLKIEVAKMKAQLKKEVNIREELEKNLEKEKAMEVLSAASIEKVPKEGSLKENKIDEQRPEEKRKSPRLELTPLGARGMLLRLATSNKDEPYLIGVVKNVSSGGIMAELDKELPSSDSVNMDLFEHGSLFPIGVLGKLIWQEKQNDSSKFKVGISFFSISKDNQERINEYIKKAEDLLFKK